MEIVTRNSIYSKNENTDFLSKKPRIELTQSVFCAIMIKNLSVQITH